MSKKKFKDTKVGQFLLNKIPGVVGSLAGNTPVGSVIKTLIGGSDMSDADKQIALKKLDQEIHEFDGITKRWVADSNSTSWLAQNVRPLTLAFLTVAFVIGWAYQLEDLQTVKELLTIVFIGYFGSRGAEKIMGNNKHKDE
jgi:hypothetical protein|tara:strand:+ start:189 stop:611 length:423 start_codon:yes stop_codon:yes gene_type:complete